MLEVLSTVEQAPSSMSQDGVARCAVLLCIAAAVSVVWLMPFGFPASNNVFHVPIVLGYADSIEGPHDAFHRSLTHFISFFWKMVAVIATEQNVKPVFLILLIVATLLTILAAYRLAVSAGASRVVVAVGCGILAFAFGGRQFMEYGNGELLSGFLTHSQYATALGLFTFALAVRERWLMASLLCGCLANINLFLGFWVMSHLLLTRILLGWQGSGRIPWLQCLRMSSLCAVATIPTIVWALRTLPASSATPTFSFSEFLYQYEPHHTFTHLQLGPFANFCVLSGALWYCFRDYVRSKQAAVLLVLSVTALAVVLTGAVLVYFSDSQLLQSFYPLRYAAMAHWICAVGVVAVWARASQRDANSSVFGAIAVLGFCLPMPTVTLLGLLFLIPESVTRMRCTLVLLAGIAISLLVPTFYGTRGNAIEVLRLGPLPVITLVSVGASALLVCSGDMPWLRRLLLVALLWMATTATIFAGQPVAALLALMVVMTAAAIAAGKDKWAAPILIAGVVVLAAYVALRSDYRTVILGTSALSAGTLLLRFVPLHWPLRSTTVGVIAVTMLCVMGMSQGVARRFDFPRWPLSDSWYAAQMWARHNTAPDALFYAPDRGAFATMSRRPVWWDDIQGAAVMWDASFYQEWNSRRLLAESAQTMVEIIALARAEKIRFLTLGRQRVPEIPAGAVEVRYCNENFCIVEVTGLTQSS